MEKTFVSYVEIFSIGPCHGRNKTDWFDLRDDSYFPESAHFIVSSKEKKIRHKPKYMAFIYIFTSQHFNIEYSTCHPPNNSYQNIKCHSLDRTRLWR